MDTCNKVLYIHVDHISGRNYVIKACPISVCHALRIFFFAGGGGRQIAVHDGYIHRFTGVKFLWITRLEQRSVKRNYLLSDKLTLGLLHLPRDSGNSGQVVNGT